MRRGGLSEQHPHESACCLPKYAIFTPLAEWVRGSDAAWITSQVSGGSGTMGSWPFLHTSRLCRVTTTAIVLTTLAVA